MIWILAALCVSHACSDDTLGQLGNERLEWDATEGATQYHIGLLQPDGSVQACGSTTDVGFDIAPGGNCDPPGRGSRYVVQMQNASGETGPWSDPVEILPFACWTADVPRDFTIENIEERPCVEDAPNRPQADEQWNPIPLPTEP